MSASSASLTSCTACISATPVTVLLIEPMFMTVSGVKGVPRARSAKPTPPVQTTLRSRMIAAPRPTMPAASMRCLSVRVMASGAGG